MGSFLYGEECGLTRFLNLFAFAIRLFFKTINPANTKRTPPAAATPTAVPTDILWFDLDCDDDDDGDEVGFGDEVAVIENWGELVIVIVDVLLFVIEDVRCEVFDCE